MANGELCKYCGQEYSYGNFTRHLMTEKHKMNVYKKLGNDRDDTPLKKYCNICESDCTYDKYASHLNSEKHSKNYEMKKKLIINNNIKILTLKNKLEDLKNVDVKPNELIHFVIGELAQMMQRV